MYSYIHYEEDLALHHWFRQLDAFAYIRQGDGGNDLTETSRALTFRPYRKPVMRHGEMV